MTNESKWLMGGGYALLCIFGLYLASSAGTGMLHWMGLLMFAIGVLLIFDLIRIAFDEAEGKAKKRRDIVPLAMFLVGLGTVLFHILSPWWWAPIASNWSYIDDTIDLTFWITGVVFILVVLFMAHCISRYRYRQGRRSEYEPESKRLEITLTVVTAVLVTAMLAPGLFVWNQFVEVPEDASDIEVVGQQWSWSYRLPGKDGTLGASDWTNISLENPMGLVPNDPHGQDDVIVESGALHVPIGKPIKVLMRSKDVLHNWYVPEFRAKMDMVPGMVTYFWFTPTRTGTFQVLCAELCGVGHALMRGEVVVQEEADYLAWLEQQQTFEQYAAARRGESLSSLAASDESQTQ